ncbi:uncharacterized protein HaLaN_18728 [Haematococcus lacustris]|uniref:RRM domain-containing protein n=1 Tax=Haematococcus lacustris TaxID=44745 RepID=A0A699ZZ63_HAELA|nr:uncharacterized protein HaLaN_18728 [Haematococcus lacustris]
MARSTAYTVWFLPGFGARPTHRRASSVRRQNSSLSQVAASASGTGPCDKVPKSYKEEDLLPLFSPFGRVCDVLIQRDKATEAPKGCAFVSFAEEDEAKAAIAGLDRQIHLPGALCPIEVSIAARGLHAVQIEHVVHLSGLCVGSFCQEPPLRPSRCWATGQQLFFSHAPKQLDEEALFIHFSQWGVVEEINIFQWPAPSCSGQPHLAVASPSVTVRLGMCGALLPRAKSGLLHMPRAASPCAIMASPLTLTLPCH